MGAPDGLEHASNADRAVTISSLDRLSFVGDWPGRRTGYARSWRARSVDLTGFDLRRTDKDGADGPEPAQGDKSSADDLSARLRRVLQPPVDLLLRDDGPLQWPHPFFSYQRVGIDMLIRSDQMLLGDEMGLGKTVQAIAALRILVHRRRIERVLIVTPSSVIDQWMQALALWAPDLRSVAAVGPASDRAWRWKRASHVTVVAYEVLRSDADSARESWDLVILDEAQKIKNPDTEIAGVCKGLSRARSWALTGTPLENKVSDLGSILDFVLDRPSRISSIERAVTLLSLTQLRRRKQAVLRDLPAKIVTELPIDLSASQRASYDRAEQDGIVKLRGQPDVTLTHVFALLTRLKQICNFDPETGVSSKLNDLKDRLDEIAESGNKALVFTQFADEIAGARRIAKSLVHLRPLVLTGQLDHRQRSAVLRRFNEDDESPVLVLTLKAGGVGLNLQRASYVFHFDRWWNPAVEAQAEDRAHRIGQPSSVNVYKYVVKHSIEQRIYNMIEEKQELFRSVVDESGSRPPAALTRADLMRLIDL